MTTRAPRPGGTRRPGRSRSTRRDPGRASPGRGARGRRRSASRRSSRSPRPATRISSRVYTRPGNPISSLSSSYSMNVRSSARPSSRTWYVSGFRTSGPRRTASSSSTGRTVTQQREPRPELRGGIRHGEELVEQVLVAGQVPQVRLVDQPEQRHRPAGLRAAQRLRVRDGVVAHVVRQDQRDARTRLRRRALGLRMQQRPVAQHDEVRHELLARGARVREDEHDAARRDLLRSVLGRRRSAERGQSLGRFRSSSSPVT